MEGLALLLVVVGGIAAAIAFIRRRPRGFQPIVQVGGTHAPSVPSPDARTEHPRLAVPADESEHAPAARYDAPPEAASEPEAETRVPAPDVIAVDSDAPDDAGPATTAGESTAVEPPDTDERLDDDTFSASMAPEDQKPAACSVQTVDPPLLEPDNCGCVLEGEQPGPAAPAAGPALLLQAQAQTAKRTAVHRDRRGERRAPDRPRAQAEASTRVAAEALLRLSLNEIQRAARLTIILTRPEGYPDTITPVLEAHEAVSAYDASRYDDLDCPWDRETLDGELRIACTEGYEWLRAARRVHIFAESAAEAGFISVGAAVAGADHALVLRANDIDSVVAAAAATGSPPLRKLEHWHGIPAGWSVLAGYKPRHSAAEALSPNMRTLDPGTAAEIAMTGGLLVRSKAYAEGKPPRIEIRSLHESARVTIDQVAAALNEDGGWRAQGYDAPGRHVVDVVPGPSLTYEIVPDPAHAGGWDFFDAYSGRFDAGAVQPWAQARICGAAVRGPNGGTVIAAERQLLLVALGTSHSATTLTPRPETPIAVAIVSELPAFLVSAAGNRRSQGQVLWTGFNSATSKRPPADQAWAAIVKSAASKRLPLVGGDGAAEQLWRKAKERARRIRRSRHV